MPWGTWAQHDAGELAALEVPLPQGVQIYSYRYY